MLACIQRIIEAAKAVGGSVDLRSLNNGTIIVDAPPGYLWSATLTAALVERASNSGQSWFAAAAPDLLSCLLAYVESEEEAAPCSSSPLRERARAAIAKAVGQ